MVETVSATPLPQGTSNGSAAPPLEPGTELKAKVESNLPGGIVRLATAEGKVDLRVAAPLPADAEVTVTVTGSKQQPVIQITTDKAPAQAGQQSGAGSQGQGGQQAQANPPQSYPTQSGTSPTAPSAQANAARPVFTATPAGAHLVQVLATNAIPASGGAAAGQVTVPSGGVVQSPAGQVPLPGQSSLPPSPQPIQTAPAQLAAPLPAGASSAAPTGTGSAPGLPTAVGGSLQAPLQSGPIGAQAPSGGAVTGSLAQQSPLPGAPTVPNSHVPGGSGQVLPPQSGTLASATPQAPGTPASSSPAASTPAAPAATPAGGVPIQTGPANGPQSGAVQQAPSALPTGAQALATGPAAATANIPTGQSGAPLAPGAQAGTTTPAPQGGASRLAQSGSQSVQAQPGSPAAAGPASTGSVATGQITASGANQAGFQPPASAQAPAVQAPAVGTGASPSGVATAAAPQPGTLPTGQGAALATLTAGTGGLGQQPGAAPVRILSGQPYQQLGGQPLGGAASAGTGQQTAAASPGPAAQVAGALRQPLAEQQAGLASLFAQVGSLMSAQSAGAVALPEPVVKAMQQILGLRLNASGATSADDLQQAVRQSGQFREAQLALPGRATGGQPDLKSALLSFKSLLQQLGARSEISRPAGQPAAPSRHHAPQGQAPQSASGYWAGAAPQNLKALMKETDAALARLRLTQLTNTGLAREGGVPHSASKPMDLVLELPLALGQETAVMQMQIGRDGPGTQAEQDGEPAWRLRFALDLTATGPLEAAISLRGGGTYASLWVERKDTFDNLNAVRETMEAAFADAGLDLQELRLIRGLPPRTAAYYGAMVDRQS